MRVFRALEVGLLAGWVLLAVYFVYWFRERYGRGPCPASQAWILDHPIRSWAHPVRPALQEFRLGPGDTVLELGPGPGHFTAEAGRMVGPKGRVLCLDIQPEMVSVLRQRLDEQQMASAHPMVADALRLPLASNSVDKAFLVTVLGEIPDRVAAVAELRRVLKPGGVLSFSESLIDPDYVFVDALTDLCRASGFSVLDRSRQRLGYTMCFTAS